MLIAKVDTSTAEQTAGPVNAGKAGSLDGKRMLFVAPDDYPAFRVDLVELFSRHLVSRGLKVDWSLRRINDGEAAIDDRGNERFFLARRRIGERFGKAKHGFAAALLRLKLARKAARGEYDLVQVRDSPMWSLPFLLAAKIARKPFVFWMSYPVLDARLRIAVKGLIPMSLPARAIRIVYAVVGNVLFRRVVLPLSDHVVVQSTRMREKLAEKGVAPGKMTPVPMGVSTERFNPSLIQPSQDPRLAGKKVLTYLCAEMTGKPGRVAMGTLAEAVAKGHDAVLVIVGNVPEFEQQAVKALTDELGISGRIIFTGRLPLAEALAYIRRADVCLSPFEMNPEQEVATPTKLVEYLAMGRPVVAAVHYDQNEVISSSGAGIITDFTSEAMAEGVCRLLSDKPRAEAMGAKGPAWVKANRDYARLADVVERLFATILAVGPGPISML